MLGHRIRQADLKAKKRFKKWYPDYNANDPAWRNHTEEELLGALRKTNVSCSCHMCRNPRHSHFCSGKEKPTVQERRAPKIEDFENE